MTTRGTIDLLAAGFLAAGLSAAGLLSVGCSAGRDSAPQAEEAVSVAPGPGSLVATHGLVLFGKERLHLSHIPVFDAMHNVQVVVEAKIVSGVPEEAQVFTDRLYTVPARFSLYDLAHGTLPRIKGTIFVGSFEQGGRPMFPNVEFEITHVDYQTGLDAATPARPTLDYLALGTPTDAYLVHVIDATQSFDSVTGITLPQNSALDAKSLEAGVFLSIENGINAVASRLAPGAEAHAILPPAPIDVDAGPSARTVADAAPSARTVADAEPPVRTEVDAGSPPPSDADAGELASPPSTSFRVRSELYCSLGPDFYTFCPAVHAPAPSANGEE